MKNCERAKFILKKIKWNLENKHNYTNMGNNFKFDSVIVGNFTYGDINVINYSNDAKLYIGHFCSIAKDVTFLLGGEHRCDLISTYPFENKILNKNSDRVYKKAQNTVIGSDVWIGHGVTILSGVKIGQGAIIGAQSIVSKNVPPYAVYVGNKIIRYRFDAKKIEKFLKIDYSNLTKEDIEKNIDDIYKEPDNQKTKLI